MRTIVQQAEDDSLCVFVVLLRHPSSVIRQHSPFGLAKSSEVRENDRAEARNAARGPKADTAEEEVARRTPNMVAFMVNWV